jgi:hypothetical protein
VNTSRGTYVLPLWTIFAPGTDGYCGYTARCFLADASGVPVITEDVVRSDTLDALRDVHRDAGRVCITRSPEDAANIVETWL